MPRLVLDGVTKLFERRGVEPIRAVVGLNLAVEEGECLVLVGPSGSGKTTVLRLIAGLERPTSGEILLNGKRLNGVPAGQREVAMVFQSPALYPHMTVRENLEFGLRLRRCSGPERARRIEEATEVLELTACLQALPNQLSGGQRQRVAIGRAIVRRAPLLLLDEPLANLDPPLRAQLRQDLARVRGTFATTMIYVTHDHLEAMLLGDRIAVLRAGHLQQLQTPRTLYQRPANMFVAEFFGFPGINFFRGRLVRRNGAIFFQATSGADLVATSKQHATREESVISGPHPIGPPVFCLPLDQRWTSRAERYLNQTVVLAFRPEQIRPALPGIRPETSATLPARVEAVHSTGADAFVKASTGGSSFMARAAANDTPAPGQERIFAFDIELARLFDPGTGDALE